MTKIHPPPKISEGKIETMCEIRHVIERRDCFNHHHSSDGWTTLGTNARCARHHGDFVFPKKALYSLRSARLRAFWSPRVNCDPFDPNQPDSKWDWIGKVEASCAVPAVLSPEKDSPIDLRGLQRERRASSGCI